MPTILSKEISSVTGATSFTGKIKKIQRGIASGASGDPNSGGGIVTISLSKVEPSKCTVRLQTLGIDYFDSSATGSDSGTVPYVSNFSSTSFTVSGAYVTSSRPTSVYSGRSFFWEIVEYE